MNFDKLPPVPLDALPGRLGEYVGAVAKAYSVDPAMPFTFALGVAAASIGRAADIRLSPSWTEIVPLWLCVIARPGAVKSPVLKELVAPVFQHDKSLGDEHAKALEQWNLAGVQTLSVSPRADRPRRQQAVVSDTTIEALGLVLQVSPRVLVYQDELGALFDSMGCYKAHGGHDKQAWLSLHNGARITVNRKGELDPLIVESPRVGIVGATTTRSAARVMLKDAGDGSIDRFYLTGAKPQEPVWPQPPIPDELAAEYVDRVLNLCRLHAGTPLRMITLAHEAENLFGELVKNTRPETAPDLMQGIMGKHRGNVGRIALTLALLENPQATEVTAAQMQAAIRVGEWLLAHTYKQRRQMLSDDDDAPLSSPAKALRRWMQHKGGMAGTCSDILAGRIPGIATAEEAKAAATELVTAGIGVFEKHKAASGRTVTRFVLSGKVSQSPKPA